MTPRSSTQRGAPDELPEIEATHLGVGSRVVIGLFAWAPIAASALAFVSVLRWPEQGLFHFRESDVMGWMTMPLLVPFFMFASWLVFGMLAYNNRRLDRGGKLAWALAFVLAGPISMPIYWFVHVWRAPS